MSVRINLLPHREEARKRRLTQYIALATVSLITALAIAGAVWAVLDWRVTNQQKRNQFIVEETAKLDKQIEEIKKIRQETADLLQKKQVVENLQSNRSEPVQLLDQLLRQLPEGVYLKSIKQTGLTVVVSGFAQSQPRVSTLMRNVSASPYLANPVLVEVKSALLANNVAANEFTMNLSIKRAAPEQPGKPAAKPAEKKA
jgi:type IV pilus assembly protein PilN